ncbi:MAG: dihydropteroate synthase [Thermoplasmata archaeon]|nr:dihydropteroate synthase [Thermoplasmata archaeon]
MENIGCDPEGIKIMENKMLSLSFIADGINSAGANILKQEMLAVGGEAAVARGTANCSVEKSGVLLHATVSQYLRLVEKLRDQPFGLSALAEDIRDGLEAYLQGPRETRIGKITVPSSRPIIMGILNVTPDSFSDGGLYHHPEKAVARVMEMVDGGADMVDIGGESSRPGSRRISAEEEWKRIGEVIRTVKKETDTPISVDTYKAEVAEKSLALGVEAINDITAGRDERLLETVGDAGAAVVLMHMQGTPETMQKNPSYEDVVGDILSFLRQQVEKAAEHGIKDIVIDPGIGFGKALAHNLEILHHLDSFRVLGRPILIGPSRKSFIGGVLDLPVEERLEGTMAAAVTSLMMGADIFRVHDVREVRRALDLAAAIRDCSIPKYFNSWSC